MTKKAMIDELVKYGVIREEARSTYMKKDKRYIEIITETALPVRKEFLTRLDKSQALLYNIINKGKEGTQND